MQMEEVIIKRLGDWLEKISAGAMLIGIFKDGGAPITITGVCVLFASIYVTSLSEKEKK
jgi:hypothetical protein